MKKLLCILSALLLLCSPLAAAETYSDEMGYQIDFPDDNWLVLPEQALALFFDGQTTFEEEIDGVKISVTLDSPCRWKVKPASSCWAWRAAGSICPR